MKIDEQIPPLIRGWIESMLDPKQKDFVRENHAMMLEKIAITANEAVMQYRRTNFKTPRS
jgi:hypothetical protein